MKTKKTPRLQGGSGLKEERKDPIRKNLNAPTENEELEQQSQIRQKKHERCNPDTEVGNIKPQKTGNLGSSRVSEKSPGEEVNQHWLSYTSLRR